MCGVCVGVCMPHLWSLLANHILRRRGWCVDKQFREISVTEVSIYLLLVHNSECNGLFGDLAVINLLFHCSLERIDTIANRIR